MERFAVIDVGSNSIRLGVVQPDAGGSYSVLSQQKEVVRLGEGGFTRSSLTAAAIDRAVIVCSQLAHSARAFGAREIVAVATAAAREASNAEEFVRRTHEQAGIDLGVISGNEEARLIYIGVASGLELAGQRLVVIDIGGGSTELAAGTAEGPAVLESTKLGAIRLANLFTEGNTGPVRPRTMREMDGYVRALAVHSLQRVRNHGFDQLYGSSGTVLNLIEIALRRRDGAPTPRAEPVTLVELQKVRETLARLPLEERRKVPGINPDRADIIVPGACILITLMEQLEAGQIRPSDRALREGLIVDHLSRQQGNGMQLDSVRARSVLQLLRRCQGDEQHAHTISRLALRLFDELQSLGLVCGGADERELLQYAALLHDIGGFVSYTDHHRHGFYLVKNSPLLGFDQHEINLLALLVLHHTKALPKRKSEPTQNLTSEQFQLVERMSVCLRLAEAIDRGHLAAVQEIRCVKDDGGVCLELDVAGDCQLAVWALEAQRNAFSAVFGQNLKICARQVPGEVRVPDEGMSARV